jgi:O-antigen/teichoic acid export membrane protein
MGIVIRQATQNAIYSYFGALLGFLTVWFLNINWLSTQQNGLLNLLISISIITGSVSNLGSAGIISRLFPHFRNNELKHQGFLFYPMAISIVGFCLFLILYFVFRDEIIARNIDKSKLFADEVYYLIPLTFFWAIFNILDAYSRSVFLTTAGVLIKEVGLRIVILIAGFAYYKSWITFDVFLLMYVISFCSIGLILGVHLWMKGELHFHRNKHFVTPELRREMRLVAMYSVITGLSSLLISSIDKIIVNDKLGLSAAGVFAVATYFGSIIQIPARSVIRIASSVIADSWKSNNLSNIRNVYHKTCLNQYIIGLYLLLGIFLCMDQIMNLLPTEYSEARYVILLVGLGYFIDLATGVNGAIISTSKYFRYDTLFMFLLVVVTIITNLLLIPAMGITGAALASCITFFTFNLLRYLFIWKKFDMQPYTIDFLKIAGIAAIALAGGWFLNVSENNYITILVKGSVFSLLFAIGIYLSKSAPDLNKMLDTVKGKIKP